MAVPSAWTTRSPSRCWRRGGYTVLGICRDLLTKVEAQYTESDFRLLSDAEASEVIQKVGYDYGREIGREIGSD